MGARESWLSQFIRRQCNKCRDLGSNRGPSDLQSDALPTELSRLLLQKVIVSLVRIQPSEADFRTCGLAELLKKQEPFLSLATSPQVLPHFHKWREAHSRAPRKHFRRGGGSGLADLLSRTKKRAPSSFRLSASPQVGPSPRGGKLRSPGGPPPQCFGGVAPDTLLEIHFHITGTKTHFSPHRP